MEFRLLRNISQYPGVVRERKKGGAESDARVISANIRIVRDSLGDKGPFPVASNIQSRRNRTVKISNCFDLRLKARSTEGGLRAARFDIECG